MKALLESALFSTELHERSLLGELYGRFLKVEELHFITLPTGFTEA